MNTIIPAIKSIYDDDKIGLFIDMLNLSVDCIKVIDSEGRLVFMNRSGCEALGVSINEKNFGMKWISLLPEAFHRKGCMALKRALSGKCTGFRGMSVSPDGKEYYWDNVLTPVLDNDGKITKILCISRNITQQVLAEKKLKVKSETDSLTGLSNRGVFKRKLKKALSISRTVNKKVGVLFIDLDNFKIINDTLGHAAGDKTLIQFAVDLKKSIPDSCFISRLGGDEFAILIENADTDVLAYYANMILDSVRCEVETANAKVFFGLTIGGALYPDNGVTEEEIMKMADIALYQQKMNGKNGFRLFS